MVAQTEKNGEIENSEKFLTENNKSLAKRERPRLFEYASLPKWEIRFYFTVIVFLFLYGFYCVADVSSRVRELDVYTLGLWELAEHPLFGVRIKDLTDWEWVHYHDFGFRFVPGLLVHSIVFNLVDYIQGRALIKALIRLIASFIISCFVFGINTVLIASTCGLLVFGVTRTARRLWCTWLSALPALYIALHYAEHLVPEDTDNQLVPPLLLSYKVVAYLSYNIEWLKHQSAGTDQKKNDKSKSVDENESSAMDLFRMFCYAFYMPYGATLIILYPDFERQLSERRAQTRNWRELLFEAGRLIFWWLLVDTSLYFLYIGALLHAPDTLYQIREDQLVSLGWAVGQFFHTKYVVIFGIPRLFAKLDKMQPYPGPICISRVVLYSRIWRYFDRGLYSFFKEYIFLPICRPTFSIPRKLFGWKLCIFLGLAASCFCDGGLCTAYAFVLVWHGVDHNNLVWIALNVIELLIESVGRAVYSLPQVRATREKYLSDTMFRRCLAWLYVLPFSFALYSNFYFLCGSEAGWIFVDRIFWQETYTLKYPFWLLISLGYCYSHVCIEMEIWEEKKGKSSKVDEEKKEQ